MKRRTQDAADTPPPRRGRGFETAGGLLEARIRQAGEKRGLALVRLLGHWAEIAGADIAAATRPVRLGYGRDGLGATLTLEVEPARAPIIEMRLPVLRERVNAALGHAAVARIRLSQAAGPATGFAEKPALWAGAAPARAADPDRSGALDARARGSVGEVRDEEFRAALEALARNVLSRGMQRKEQ
jgi:hypothetical protein